MKIFQLTLTIVVVCMSVVACAMGRDASWIAVFAGWGLVLLGEISDISKKVSNK